MAATIATATGNDSNRSKTVHRLGSQYSNVIAATWRTFAYATVMRDGSGYVEVIRDGVKIHRFDFGAESVRDRKQKLEDVALAFAIQEAEAQTKYEANEDVKGMSNAELKIRKDELERSEAKLSASVRTDADFKAFHRKRVEEEVEIERKAARLSKAQLAGLQVVAEHERKEAEKQAKSAGDLPPIKTASGREGFAQCPECSKWYDVKDVRCSECGVDLNLA